MDFQQAFDTGVLVMQHTTPNCAPVQLAYASWAIMHDIDCVKTTILIFQRWTVSFYSYIERLTPVNSYAPGIVNPFKTANFCSSSIDLCQESHHARNWVCGDNNYGFPTLDSFLLSLYRKAAYSEQLCSWRTLKMAKFCVNSIHLCHRSHHAWY